MTEEMLAYLKKQQRISAILVEVEGMKAENAHSLVCYDNISYTQHDFYECANRIENIINEPI